MPTPNDKQLYLDATQEVDSGTQDPALWAKAMALDKGDEGKAKYRYIALRVEELTEAPAAAPPEYPASIINNFVAWIKTLSEEVARSRPDNSASQTPDQETKFDPAGPVLPRVAPLPAQPSSTTKRIPEGWIPLTGADATSTSTIVISRLANIRAGTERGIIVDGIWYVPRDERARTTLPFSQSKTGSMNETTEKAKRPTSITILCVIAFAGVPFSVPLIFSPISQQVGSWFPPYLGFSVVTGLACMVGLWMMKKWAAYTYTGFVAINQIFLLDMGAWHVTALLIPAIVIFVALKNVSKMT